jgi:hypothetical protein
MAEVQLPPKKRARTGYSVNRKVFYLTYPKCPLDPKEALEQLKKIAPIKKYIIAQERHKDGDAHLHCYIMFENKVHRRNPRWADLEEKELILTQSDNEEEEEEVMEDLYLSRYYHFNDGGTVRNVEKVAKYCTKDGNYISNFWEPKVESLVFNLETKEEAIKMLKEKSPGLLLRSYNNIKNCLEDHYGATEPEEEKEKLKPKYELEDFSMEALDLTLPVLIYGPSNCGKTQFAKAHFNAPLLVSHIETLRRYDPAIHDGIVFDDISFAHWPPESVIHLLDIEEERDLHMRYKVWKKPAGLKMIFTHNSGNGGSDPNIFYDPLGKISIEQITAIHRRYTSIYLATDIRK